MDTTVPAATVISAVDRRSMDRAVELGRRGWGRVQPNPMVGCVLVRQGEVVGEGWHGEFGGPHAEIVALSEAGAEAKGATAYISLEPCHHEGKTPPCSVALRGAGVSRMVFGAPDPGRESAGGAAALRAGGVDVVGPVLTEREFRRENPAFFQTTLERPWVALKLAVSLDGKISSKAGVRTGISGTEANDRVQWLRAGFDAILIGTNTALVDDPLLTVRGKLKPRVPPRRVILDAEGKVSAKARVLHEGDAPVSFFTTTSSPDAWRVPIEAAGATVSEVSAGSHGGVSLSAALGTLREEGVRILLCEGGGSVGSGLLTGGLVDRLYLIVAPKLIGPEGVSAFQWIENSGLSFPPQVSEHSGRPIGDWVLSEEPRRFGHDVWMVLEPRGE